MASFTIMNARQPPEIWIMQTSLRLRRPVTTKEFLAVYKYSDPADGEKVLHLLFKNKRLKRTIAEDGTYLWSYR